MALDIRKVDVRYRLCAIGVIFMLVLTLVTAMSYMWLQGRTMLVFQMFLGYIQQTNRLNYQLNRENDGNMVTQWISNISYCETYPNVFGG